MQEKCSIALKNSILWDSLQWEPSCVQLEQMITLQVLLKEWNRKINLSRLLEEDDYWVTQIFDSLWPLKNELRQPNQRLNCIDVGTGCGFPGLAIAIALPNISMDLVDSIHKKTNVIAKISQELGLTSRVKIHTERIESIGQDSTFRGSFDLAMARAVAPPPVVAEYLVPLIKHEGEAIMFLGQWNESTKNELFKALQPLKAVLSKVECINLPARRGIRHQIRLRSKLPCPNHYPRSVGTPTKKPLNNQSLDNLS